jgi:hypothetical protein
MDLCTFTSMRDELTQIKLAALPTALLRSAAKIKDVAKPGLGKALAGAPKGLSMGARAPGVVQQAAVGAGAPGLAQRAAIGAGKNLRQVARRATHMPRTKSLLGGAHPALSGGRGATVDWGQFAR